MKKQRRMLVLVEKELDSKHGKTAHGVIRYTPEEVVAVIDSKYAGKTCQQAIGYGGAIPIVASVEDGLKYQPDSFLIGLAIAGGVLPTSWREIIVEAIKAELTIINGLHTYLSSDEELAQLAKRFKVELIDLRIPPPIQRCAEGRPLHNDAKVILTVGTEGSIGKMSATLEICQFFKHYRPNSTCIATGQTGMLIMGNGYAVDAIKGDFIGGVMEEVLIDESKRNRYLFVEGQGSLLHQGYSAVTLGLMHGCLPDALIMCHHLGLTHNELGVKVPPLQEFIALHEQIIGWIKPSKVVGIALNTANFSDDAARRGIEDLEKELGLPVEDCVRYGGKKIADALDNYFAKEKSDWIF